MQNKPLDQDKGLGWRLLGDLMREQLNAVRHKQRRRLRQALNRPRAAVVVGAGSPNGIGGAVARRAAAAGLPVYVAGRNTEKIQATAKLIGDAATAVTLDAGDPDSIARLFARIADDGYDLDLVVHNVGANLPRRFLDITPEMLERAWQQDAASGFEVSRHALKAMSDQGFGTLLFTGASAALCGKAGFAAFAQAKAGLRMLAQALAREFGPQGIHVAHVIIDGQVDGDRLRQVAPGFLDALGEEGSLDPAAIADIYWQVHQQHPSTWTHEIDLRPFKENW